MPKKPAETIGKRIQDVCDRARPILVECEGDPHLLALAFQSAVIAFVVRGNSAMAKSWRKDAAIIRHALKAMGRHGQHILDKLGTQATLEISPEAALAAVVMALRDVVTDLDRPVGILRERRDAAFLRLLGTEFRKRGLRRPSARLLRELHIVVTGEPFNGDDSALLHAFR